MNQCAVAKKGAISERVLSGGATCGAIPATALCIKTKTEHGSIRKSGGGIPTEMEALNDEQ